MKLVSSLSGSVKLCGLGLSPGRLSISGGKTGRRTWFEQEETAASKRSSASATMAEDAQLYTILTVTVKQCTQSSEQWLYTILFSRDLKLTIHSPESRSI